MARAKPSGHTGFSPTRPGWDVAARRVVSGNCWVHDGRHDVHQPNTGMRGWMNDKIREGVPEHGVPHVVRMLAYPSEVVGVELGRPALEEMRGWR